MFDYTYVAGQRVLRNIKRISLAFNIATQAISILVLAYITFFGAGFLPVTIPLLILSTAYFVFYCVTARQKEKTALRKRIKLFFKWSKRAIKLVNLGVMLYALFTAKAPTAFDIVLVCFSLGCWVLDIFFEIATIVVKSWALLMWEALKTDTQIILAPLTATKNFLRGLTGKEVESPPPPTKQRLLLDELVAERKEELAERRERQKEQAEKLKESAEQAAEELRTRTKEEKKRKRKEKKEEKRQRRTEKKGKGAEQSAEVLEETAAANDE